MDQKIENFLTSKEIRILNSIDSPAKIQTFLDDVPYSPEEINRNPVRVLRDRLAHCLDGALFAGMALRRIGFPPLIVDLLPDPGTDDDHILAIFRQNGKIGAIAKSNFMGLRYREPVYRNLHELVMSYFELYHNIKAEKTLRFYTRPMNLARYDRYHWMWEDQGADKIEQRLLTLKRIQVLQESEIAILSPVDPLTYRANMLETNPDGLYKPGQSSH